MTNKFRITKKKDGTVSYHMEGSSDFINGISDKILNSKKASKTDLMKSYTPSQQHKPTDHHILNMPVTIKPKPPKKQIPLVKPEGETVYSESEPNTMAEALKKLDIKKENDDRPEQPEDTSYYYTGIKEKDGKKLYRCRYMCHSCSNVGNHYIPHLIDNVKCHNCSADLSVRSVADMTGYKKDLNANWYVAGQYLPKTK